MPFKNTKLDYVIFLGATIVFLHAFFTIEQLPLYSKYWPNSSVIIGYGLKMGIQVILAPIIIIHRIFIIFFGNAHVLRLKERQLKLKTKIGIYNSKQYIIDNYNKLTKNQKYFCKYLWIQMVLVLCVTYYLIFIF